MKYEPIAEVTPDQMTSALEADDVDALLVGVLGASLYWEDREAAEVLCRRLASHAHFNVRGNAVLGLGHIAMGFGAIDLARSLPVVRDALDDPHEYVRGHARSALDDIEHFVLRPLSG